MVRNVIARKLKIEVSPGIQLKGHCMIGNYCTIGTNDSILPRIKIGNGVTVGAGVVVKDVVDGFNCNWGSCKTNSERIIS